MRCAVGKLSTKTLRVPPRGGSFTSSLSSSSSSTSSRSASRLLNSCSFTSPSLSTSSSSSCGSSSSFFSTLLHSTSRAPTAGQSWWLSLAGLCLGGGVLLASSASTPSSPPSTPSSLPSSPLTSFLLPDLHAEAAETPKPSADGADGMGTTFTKPSSVDLGSLSDDGSGNDSSDEGTPKKRRRRRRRKKKVSRKKAKVVVRKPPVKYEELDNTAKATLMDFANLVIGAGLTVQTQPLQDPMNMDVGKKQQKHFELSTVMDLSMQEATALKGTLVLGEAQNIVMHGSVDCEMGTNGRLAMYDTLYPGLNFEMHFNQAVRPDKMMYNNFVLQTGYKGTDWNCTATAVNGLQLISTDFVQSVTPYTAVGAGLTHKWGRLTKLGFGARHSVLEEDKTGYVLAGSYTDSTWSVSYTRHASPSMSLATDLKYAPSSGDLVSRLGLALKHRTFTFNGMIDSEGTQMAILESTLAPNLQLSLCGIASHVQGRSMWGMNVMLAL